MPEGSTSVKRLTDSKLISLAKKFKTAKTTEADAKSEAETVAGQIIPELQRRGIKALEGQGVRVNMVAGEYTEYDMEEMERVLGPRKFKQVTKVVVDTDAMKAALDSGLIKPKTLAKFATTQKKKPYILVSYVAGS